MSNIDINVDRRTDGQKIGCLYHTLLQAGAIKMTLIFHLRNKPREWYRLMKANISLIMLASSPTVPVLINICLAQYFFFFST